MMRSGNPALRNDVFTSVRSRGIDSAMTIQGTVNKTFLLLVVAVACASWVWRDPMQFLPFIGLSAAIGFVVALVTIFKKEWSWVTAPLYAAVQGVVLGGISALFERSYPGIVIQAVMLTFGVLFALLMAYKSKLIAVTDNFRFGVVAATGGIAVLYLVSMVMGFFGARIPFIHESGPLGIGFSIVVVIIASLNLVLDFDFIERGAEVGAPRYMEWYGAFGLLVTLVWLYFEILRLLAKTRNR